MLRLNRFSYRQLSARWALSGQPVGLPIPIALLCVGLLLGATAVSAQPICGNGITEPGEQCDVADTPSGLDECDACNVDCTITAECGPGPCTDNIDNDGDGLIDERDPKCSSLFQFSTMAAAGVDPRFRGVRMGVGARIDESILDAGAGVCAQETDLRNLVTISGSVTTLEGGRFSHHLSSGIGGKFVTQTGATPRIPLAAVLVGPPAGTCATSGGPCLSGLDCADVREECVGRLKLNAVNPFVDLTGTGAGADEMNRCQIAISQAMTDTSLLSLGDPAALGDLRVSRNAPVTLDLGPGATVLSYGRVRMAVGSVLTINGPPRSSVIIRINRRLTVLSRARVELTGGINPENVLWMVIGKGGGVLIDHNSLFQGFVWAPTRGVAIKSRSELRGTAIAKQVRMARNARIEHRPYLSLLPSMIELTASTGSAPINAPGPLTYTLDLTNTGPGWAGVVNLRLALDPQVSFTSASTSQGLCLHDGSPSGGTLSCFLGSLGDPVATPANAASVQVTVTVGAGASELTSTATLGHTVSLDPDQVLPIVTSIP